MSFGLGFWAAAGAGGGGGVGAYELIETTILGSSAASVTFSGLGAYSSTYKHLQVRSLTKSPDNDFSNNFSLRLNSDTGSNYAHHRLYGNGSSVATFNATGQTNMVCGRFARSSGSLYSPGVIDILDAFSTTKNTTIRAFYNSWDATFVMLNSGFWNNTAAVSTLTFICTEGQNFSTGSRFSLYGIKG